MSRNVQELDLSPGSGFHSARLDRRVPASRASTLVATAVGEE